MDEREGLHTRYLSAAWLEAVKAARQILVLLRGLEKHHLFMLQVLVKWNSDPNFIVIYIEFLPEKKVISGFKRTNPRIYCHFLFVAFSIH